MIIFDANTVQLVDATTQGIAINPSQTFVVAINSVKFMSVEKETESERQRERERERQRSMHCNLFPH